MGRLSTHVLDTANGCPAAGMTVHLHRLAPEGASHLHTIVLNADGRNTDGALLQGDALVPGKYRLMFEVAAYFRQRGAALPEPPFIETVPVDFGVADAHANYHVPLLVSPWAYSTYRGS